MTDLLAARYASLPVPRYTSYPTAPHFSDAVGPEEARRWLAELDADEPVSVYLHVPYCRAICHYCGCHTKATQRDQPLTDYAISLSNEIALVGHHIGRWQPVSHIHWGGGTPGLLPRASMLAVVADLTAHFDVQPGAEHAIELDPRGVTEALAETLAEIGITRASLGVQDLEPQVQRAIGRVQPFEVVAVAVERLRRVGIEAINADLMYGLPLQSATTIESTVRQVVSLQPSRIALFGYAHVPWFKANQKLIDAAALPGAAARLELEAAARAALEAAGYVAVGLDHFARPDDAMAIAAGTGDLKRNFQGYTTDSARTLIGIGASAISRLPGGFAQNALDVGSWRRAVDAGRLATAKGRPLDADDRLRADIIEQVMCSYAVDLDRVCAAHGTSADHLGAERAAVARLADDGLVAISGNRITVTEVGRPYVRVVAAAFDAYLARAAARHSTAV